MLTKRQLAVLFILTLLPFAVYTLRPDIIGYDGYHFLSISAGIKAIEPTDSPIFYLLTALNGNVLAVKVLLFLLCYCSVLAMAKIGELYDTEKGWRAGILVFLAAAFLFECAKFENDQFAYPLIMWSTYFFLSSYQKHNIRHQLYSVLLLIGGCILWGGSAFQLVIVALAPGAIVLQVFAIPAIILFTPQLLTHAAGWGVLENVPFLGIPFMGFLLLGVYFWRKKELAFPGFVLLAFGILNPKFIMLSIPFLVAGIVQFYKRSPIIAQALQNIAIILILFAGAGLLLQFPSEYEHETIKYAVEQSAGNEMWNDWELGYIVQWRGGITDNWGFGKNSEDGPGIVITHRFLDCELLRGGDLNVYIC